ncbi:uncharacterized protein GIQ15_05339 [Arthroderma uncinatum]|uniref:uncharacterized protein n=1 Tax=Arthroderma uncinatum TaxID=74035 RepID=UPI00144A57AF|nr:uncharacterized protein GIQ15_05339 [Arthroderma uncinatum]KAF3482580.1 hypothetical protein GIQ15_05339 [Arthroderma uncinatum]
MGTSPYGSGHGRGLSDTVNTSRGSTRFAQGAYSPPSPAWSAEDSKIGVHNGHNAASKAAASAAFFGKKHVSQDHAQPPLSSMRAETPRRDSTTLGTAYRLDGPTIGAFPAETPDVFESGAGMGNEEGNVGSRAEEEHDENEWEDEDIHDTAGAVASQPGPKDKDEWVKEETKETPEQTSHITQRHSEVTEYIPENSADGVSGQHIERKIEKDTVRKEIIEKRVDNQASENTGKPAQKPSYAAMVAKEREPSPVPAVPLAPIAPAAPAAPVAPVVRAAPEMPPAPIPPLKVPTPSTQAPAPAPAPVQAPAPVPIPAPIPVPLMKQEQPPAERTEQPQAATAQEQVPAPTANQEAIPATKQEVPPTDTSGLAAPVVPVKAPERMVATDPVLPGSVPALASADAQVQAAVATAGTSKVSENKEAIRKQADEQKSQLTRQQRKEVEKEEKVRRKQKAKEQKARDKEFKESQKQLRKGHLRPADAGAKKLGLRQRIANRLSKYLV